MLANKWLKLGNEEGGVTGKRKYPKGR